MVSFEA
jgi:hypothetical protein